MTGLKSENKKIILYILLSLNMLVILAMMFLMIKNICLNYDEFFSVNWTALSWKDLMATLKADVHPPLYYVGLKLIRTIFGTGILPARIYSLVPSLFLVLLTFLVKRELGWKAAFWYLNFLMGNVFWFQKSTEIRMYPWLAFWCVCNAFFFYEVMQHKKRKYWILFAVSGVAAAYTQYYGIPLMVCTYIGLGLWSFFSKDKKNIISWLLVCGVTVLCYLPWLPVAFSQIFTVTGNYWIPFPESKVWVLMELVDSTIPYVTYVYMLILLLMPVLAFVLFLLLKGQNKARAWWMLVTVSGVWFTWAIGMGYMLLKDRPVLVSRYLIAGLIVFMLGSAAFMEKVPAVVVALFCGVFFVTGSNYFYQRYDSVRHDQTDKLLAFCDDNIKETDHVYFWEDGYGYLSFCMNYYIDSENIHEMNSNNREMEEDATIWFFQNERVDGNENVKQIESEMEYVGEYAFGSEKVWIYRKE